MHALDEFRGFVTPAEPLAPLTWFRLGGKAEFLAKPRSFADLTALMAACREADLPVRVLAGGSNILVRDEGVRGVVIHLESPAFSDVTLDGNWVEAGAAVPLTALISQTARAGLAGLEILTGIPGTVGGALRGNARVRGGSISQFVRKATVLTPSGEVLVREKDELTFDDENSSPDEALILSTLFELEREDPETVVRRMRRIWIVKKENQPYGHQSSGSIFRDPSSETSARMLIEQAGLKGARSGGAEVSERHANYIVAQPGATSADVIALIKLIQSQVRTLLGVDLTLQIQIW